RREPAGSDVFSATVAAMQHWSEATRPNLQFARSEGQRRSGKAAPLKLPLQSSSVTCFFRLVSVDTYRLLAALDHVLVDNDLDDVGEVRKIKHGVEQDRLDDRAKPTRARLPLDRLFGDGDQRIIGEGQRDLLQIEQLLILLDQR